MLLKPKYHLGRKTTRGALLITCAALPAIAPGVAAAAEPEAPLVVPGVVADFNLSATAGVVDFRVHYPDVFLPFIISGGILESSATASGAGTAEGIAGPMPVPAMNSGGLLAPTNVPGTEIPVPEEARQGYGSIDFTRFPNACISRYPEIRAGDAEAFCGGSAVGDEGTGFTAAAANGHTTSSGDPEDSLQTRAMAESRAWEVTVPGLQAAIHNGWAKTTSGLNPQDGVPESRAQTHADELSFLGGAVRFTGLRSEALVRTDGTEAGTSVTTAFTFRDASVGGVPVVVGPDGVAVREEALGSGDSPREAANQLGAALKANDLEIRFVPAPPPIRENGQISVQSAGIEIVHRGSTFTPADSVYRFGFAAARGNAIVGEDPGGVSAGGETGGHDVVLSGDAPSSMPGSDAALDWSLMPALPAQGSGEGAADFFSAVGPVAINPVSALPTQGVATGPSGAGGPPTARLERAPARLVVPAYALTPLPYNSLTRVFGCGLALALLAGGALPLRRYLTRER